jgi:hypothetical protein
LQVEAIGIPRCRAPWPEPPAWHLRYRQDAAQIARDCVDDIARPVRSVAVESSAPECLADDAET